MCVQIQTIICVTKRYIHYTDVSPCSSSVCRVDVSVRRRRLQGEDHDEGERRENKPGDSVISRGSGQHGDTEWGRYVSQRPSVCRSLIAQWQKLENICVMIKLLQDIYLLLFILLLLILELVLYISDKWNGFRLLNYHEITSLSLNDRRFTQSSTSSNGQ